MAVPLTLVLACVVFIVLFAGVVDIVLRVSTTIGFERVALGLALAACVCFNSDKKCES